MITMCAGYTTRIPELHSGVEDHYDVLVAIGLRRRTFGQRYLRQSMNEWREGLLVLLTPCPVVQGLVRVMDTHI